MKRLALGGSERARITFCLILFRNIDDVAVFNQEWDQWVAGAPAPSRACVGVDLANPAMKVEMIAVCAVGNDRADVDPA